jgi:uncharacterized membrane protein
MATPLRDVTSESTSRLKGEVQNLFGAVRDRALDSVKQRATEAVGRLTDYTDNGGGPGLMAAVTGAKDLAEGKSPGRAMLHGGVTAAKEKVKGLFGKGKGGKGQGKKLKVTNIIESIDVGVPVRVAYNQWTQFRDFPSFMKKVENVEQEEDEKLQWRAQVFWSHRNWKSTIVRQVPDQEIVWRSDGDKGYVDGAVTFHEIGPNLTRILLVLEYNPKGFFERTGNLWRAQGRRARLELKHFRRHVMTQTLLQPDEVEGWRGVIEDGQVVKDHETALAEEQEGEESQTGEGQEGEPAEDEARGEYSEDEAEDEYSGEDVPEDEAPEDEYPEDEVPEDEVPEDEVPEDEAPEDEAPEDEYPEDEYGEEPAEDESEEPPEDEAAERDREPASRRRPARGRRTAGERPVRRRSAPARAR